jgi:hypothetical protein
MTQKPVARVRSSLRLAATLWGPLSDFSLNWLAQLIRTHGLSVEAGDVQYLSGVWYVTHAGLLRLAQRRRCSGISVRAVPEFCDPAASRWTFAAAVRKRRSSAKFEGDGDADPSNVAPLVRGAEMRVAETRAVNRALRKAYGIGLCSVEELGWMAGSSKPSTPSPQPSGSRTSNGSGDNQPRLRDRLCLLIRQYNLDPTLVKAYAADFCGTAELREASRDLVESFISQLAAAAHKDRDALLCRLNSYVRPGEVKS